MLLIALKGFSFTGIYEKGSIREPIKGVRGFKGLRFQVWALGSRI